MELLQRLPLEVERKIYLYLRHPLAELFMKEFTPSKPPTRKFLVNCQLSYVNRKLFVRYYRLLNKSDRLQIVHEGNKYVFVHVGK